MKLGSHSRRSQMRGNPCGSLNRHCLRQLSPLARHACHACGNALEPGLRRRARLGYRADRDGSQAFARFGHSLQAPNKSIEGTEHADRNAQFEHINVEAEARTARSHRRGLHQATVTARACGRPSCNGSPTSSTSRSTCHFPPDTTKWNKIEHRLRSFISINWRGPPLRTYEAIINLMGNTTNRGGLVVVPAARTPSFGERGVMAG